MVAITKFDRKEIISAVKQMYTQVAQKPEAGFHFPTGREACEFLGYPADHLDILPATAIESFAGVGYPFLCNVMRSGDTVLDIGAGSGTDALISSIKVGPQGKVYGLDITDAMREKLYANANKMSVSNVELVNGTAEEIPLPDESVDVVTSNGVLNLVPDKEKAFAEIYRVLRSGGHIQISDVVINQQEDDLNESKDMPRLWAECIVGALHKNIYVQMLTETGLKDVKVLCEQDYFSRSSNESTRKVAEYFDAKSITVSAFK